MAATFSNFANNSLQIDNFEVCLVHDVLRGMFWCMERETIDRLWYQIGLSAGITFQAHGGWCLPDKGFGGRGLRQPASYLYHRP